MNIFCLSISYYTFFQIRKKILDKAKDGSLKVINGEAKAPKKRGRWDQTIDEVFVPSKKKILSISTPSGEAATPVWGDADVSRYQNQV